MRGGERRVCCLPLRSEPDVPPFLFGFPTLVFAIFQGMLEGMESPIEETLEVELTDEEQKLLDTETFWMRKADQANIAARIVPALMTYLAQFVFSLGFGASLIVFVILVASFIGRSIQVEYRSYRATKARRQAGLVRPIGPIQKWFDAQIDKTYIILRDWKWTSHAGALILIVLLMDMANFIQGRF